MINITAPINNLGYGVASYNIVKALFKQGEKLQLHPIGPVDPGSGGEFLQDIMQNHSLQLDSSAPSVKIWHQNDIHHHIGKSLHVGFPIFELDTFNDNEIWSMKHNDRLFVCSEWAKNTIKSHKHIDHMDVRVVPLGVDSAIFKPKSMSRPTTVFFNCGKWEKRKGHDILVECFNDTFDHQDDVELWMMCDNPFLGEKNNEWVDLYKKSKLGNKIRIIPRQPRQSDVFDIMSQVDCGVFPTRAEGWNLELLEMMACGKNVIATNYSAHTEFCDSSNCRLVDIDSLETAFDGIWFTGGGLWAAIGEKQKKAFSDHMRSVYSLKKNGKLEQNIAGITTARKFSWKNSAAAFLEGLRS